MDNDFITRICFIAAQAKAHQYDDVAAWMQRHLSADIVLGKQRRGARRRSTAVRLAKARGAVAFIGEQRLRELMEHAK